MPKFSGHTYTRYPYRLFRSAVYNYNFDMRNGQFERWGIWPEDDPPFSPFGPEIADIEISVGDCSGGCPWCYKGNEKGNGQHMSLRMFESIIDMFPNVLTQVALGMTDLDANSDFLEILRACRDRDIVPNLTTSGHGLWGYILNGIVKYAGAVAVSLYPHTLDVAYSAIGRLTNKAGEDREDYPLQVNVHLLYHAGNLGFVREQLQYISEHYQDKVKAVVLLGLKPKGRGSSMQPASPAQFREIVDFAQTIDCPIGFDSCSAHKFSSWLKGRPEESIVSQYVEPCESTLFSIYVDVNGQAYPCSFSEDIEGIKPVNMLTEDTFNDVWMSWPFSHFRKELLKNGRKCPLYDID